MLRDAAGLEGSHLLLYDGDCGLCDRVAKFVLARDPRRAFLFASLQGAPGREILRRHGADAGTLRTFFIVTDYGTGRERLLRRARAAIFLLEQLGRPWSSARWMRLIPFPVLDRAYDFVAANRYRWFGRLDACLGPSPEVRRRFPGAGELFGGVR